MFSANGFTSANLNDEVGDDTAVANVHAWTESVEDSRNTHFNVVLSKLKNVSETKGIGDCAERKYGNRSRNRGQIEKSTIRRDGSSITSRQPKLRRHNNKPASDTHSTWSPPRACLHHSRIAVRQC